MNVTSWETKLKVDHVILFLQISSGIKFSVF